MRVDGVKFVSVNRPVPAGGRAMGIKSSFATSFMIRKGCSTFDNKGYVRKRGTSYVDSRWRQDTAENFLNQSTVKIY